MTKSTHECSVRCGDVTQRQSCITIGTEEVMLYVSGLFQLNRRRIKFIFCLLVFSMEQILPFNYIKLNDDCWATLTLVIHCGCTVYQSLH